MSRTLKQFKRTSPALDMFHILRRVFYCLEIGEGIQQGGGLGRGWLNLR